MWSCQDCCCHDCAQRDNCADNGCDGGGCTRDHEYLKTDCDDWEPALNDF